jgi:5'-nucleotidase
MIRSLRTIGVVARKDPRNIDYYWLQNRRSPKPDVPDSETTLIGAGRITATPLQFERTNEAAFAALKDKFES